MEDEVSVNKKFQHFSLIDFSQTGSTDVDGQDVIKGIQSVELKI